VVAELPNARLVEMKVKPGDSDKHHEHPAHSMYFVADAKLEIKNGNPLEAKGNVVEIPAGAAPIFPAGAHQVKNVGDKVAHVIFVEPMPTCKPCGDVPNSVTPFITNKECYKILAEDDDWITGEMTMEPGASDACHNHKDHLIYVISGDEITIYPDGDVKSKDTAVVPIKPFSGIPAPCAHMLFGKHSLKNSGKTPVKMIFFEMKK